MIERRTLPLFPLNVVLFPGADLPLHIFEERYKLMVQRCVDSDSLFGVVLIKSGAEVGEPAEPHSVGTVAEIIDVQKLDDGRMLLKTRGHSRFSIVELSQEIPYLEGQVEALAEDTGEEIPAELLESIREATVR